MVTTPVLWKDLTQINTSDGGAIQANGQIAPLQNGGYVVVWADGSNVHNPTGFAIVGQVYNALGEKVGGEVLLSASANAFQPEAITLENGNIAVAFIDHGANDNVLVRIFDPTLALVRTDTIANSALHEFNPSLTALDGGAYAVTFTRPSGSFDDVMVRFVSGDGSIGDATEIHSGLATQDHSELTRLANGNLVTVFQVESIGTSIFYNRFAIHTPNGAPIGGADVPSGNGGIETRPDLAALSGGGFVVVWTQVSGAGTDIRAVIYNDLGNVVNDGVGHAGILVNTTTTGNQNDASIVALADGGFLVAWEDETAGKAHGQRFDASGDTIGSEFIMNYSVTPNATEAPIRMALLADGRVAFVAHSSVGTDYDVVTSIWDPRDAPNGGTEGADVLISPPTGGTVNGLGGNDTIFGLGGPDTLDGGPGADVMHGGGGDDAYVVDNGGDQVIEAPGQGTDSVFAAVSFALSANVENLTLIGSAAIDGAGNDLANTLTGNAAANILTGGAGTDSFVFNTALNKKTNIDTITDFSVIDDTILLDNAIFTKLKSDGPLKGKYFEVGKKADDKDDFIVYNKKTGELTYDKNGDHKGGAVVFAVLEGSPDDLSKADFLVI